MKKILTSMIALAIIFSAKADLVVDSLGAVSMGTVSMGTAKITTAKISNFTMGGGKIINNYSNESINFDPYRGIYYADFTTEALFNSQRPQYGFSVGSVNAFTAYFYNGNSYPYPVITAQAKSPQGTLFMGRNASNDVTSKINADGSIHSRIGFLLIQSTSSTRSSQTVTNALDGINSLTPITYTLNTQSRTTPVENNEQQSDITSDPQKPLYEIDTRILSIMEAEQQRPKYGFVVQELERAFPNVVYTTDTGEKAIAYQEIIPVLVCAIKEQQELIDNLNEEIEELKQPLTTQRQQAPAALQEAIADGSALLMQNTPNPFNQATEIGYRLPKGTATAMIMLCDMNGKMLQTYPLPVNTTSGTLTIQAGSYTPGMYLYTLLVDGIQIDTKQMIILAH